MSSCASSFFPIQQTLSSPTASDMLVGDPSAASTESLDSLGPGQEEIQPDIQLEIQPEILTGSSQDGLTVGSNQNVVPSPPHLDTDHAPMMCSTLFQDLGTSPPSSFCSTPQTELATAKSLVEPLVQLQDTFKRQDPHRQQDSLQPPFSQWHIHRPAPQPPAQFQIGDSPPEQQEQQQQPNATADSVALDGDNSVAPQHTHSSERECRPPLALSPSSAASLLAPAAPPAELTAAQLVERNVATLDTSRECDPVQSSQQSSTKVLKPSVQQINQKNTLKNRLLTDCTN